jgi:basic membrane protein A
VTRFNSFTAIAMVLLLTLAACGGGTSSTSSSKFRIAVLGVDVENDVSFNQAAMSGIRAAAQTAGAQVTYAENLVTPAQVQQQGAAFASRGYNLVVALNGGVPDTMVALAKQFPHVFFCEIASYIANRPSNLCTYNIDFQDGSFAQGVLAGALTKTNRVGAIGAADFPVLTSELEGFILGARYINHKVIGSETYINTTSDVAKAQTAANAQIAAGADFITIAAASAVQGVIKAAEGKPGTYVMAQYWDVHALGPDVVLATAPDDLAGASKEITQLAVQGKLTNQNYSFGAADGVGKLTSYYGLSSVVTPTAQKDLDAVETMMATGALRVPFLAHPGLAESYDISQLPPLQP